MLCRLCLIDSTEVLNIFEGNGEQLQIADIIGQHFWFVPIKDDQISNICCTCWLKVNGFHQFYCFIKDAQKKLSEIFLADQRSHQGTTRSLLKQENNNAVEDEWMHDTAVKEYVNVLQDKIVNKDIDMKLEHCDNDASIDDKFEEIKDPLDTDNTNQSDEIYLKMMAETFGNDISHTSFESQTSYKRKLKIDVKKNNDKIIRDGFEKNLKNKSDSEEDLPLIHSVEKKSKRDKHEKSEYLEKSKEKDDFIANFMTLKCVICHEEFTTFAQIKQHHRINHNKRGFVVCCNRKFYQKQLLVDHINIHLNSEYFKCNECNKTYSDNKCLKNHMKKKHSILNASTSKHSTEQKSNGDCKSIANSDNSKERDNIIANFMKLKCEICCEEFRTFVEIDQHYSLKHNTKGYVVCCNKKFNRKYMLFDHINLHLNPECFKCKECNKICSDRNCLKQHILKHESKYKCDQCHKKYPKEYLLAKHKLSHIPQEERQFKCDDCERAFPTMYLLQRHCRYVHENAYGKMCHICAKVINGKSKFEKHQLEHAGIFEPKVQCEKCGAWLKNIKYILKNHMELHIKSSIIHKCDICGKISPNERALKKHKNYLHEAKKYQCAICEKGFIAPLRLKEHMATHTGEILYTCQHCPKTFNALRYLYSHQRKMHKNEWEKSKKDRCVS